MTMDMCYLINHGDMNPFPPPRMEFGFFVRPSLSHATSSLPCLSCFRVLSGFLMRSKPDELRKSLASRKLVNVLLISLSLALRLTRKTFPRWHMYWNCVGLQLTRCMPGLPLCWSFLLSLALTIIVSCCRPATAGASLRNRGR